jgi:hypothetical protein
MLCWQGEGNVYDKRLLAYVTHVSTETRQAVRLEKAQTHATWQRLWGPGERKAILDVPLKNTLDLEKLPLDTLALPAAPALKEKPGADLTQLLGSKKGK